VTTTTGTKVVAPKTVPPLAADLDAGLRRLKLATVRRTAPDVLQVAKTQRWTPEEVLRTLIEAEIAARDASNTADRLKAAAFPVIKTLEGFDVSASSIPQATFDYLSSLEWVRAQHNLAIVGRPGTGKSHTLIGLGHAAVHAGHKVRYFTAADLIDTLCRGLADNTVGKIIDAILRADLVIIDEIGFAPLDDTGTQLLFRLVAAYERRSLAVASLGPFEQWGRFLPEHTTAASILDRLLHHASVVIPTAPRTVSATPNTSEVIAAELTARGRDFSWPPAGTSTWQLTIVLHALECPHGGHNLPTITDQKCELR
jgi:DNA replication protein DnaC